MTTSKTSYNEAFVWIWLPEETEPVVAGRLEADNGNLLFNYGKSYLERVHDSKQAISIYEGELPLKAGILPLLDGLNMPGCIRDGAPDAWGRRVIINKKLGAKGTGIDTAQLDELTYLLESGSDRIGALDFQTSATEYTPRLSVNVALRELLESTERVEKGIPLTPELDQALFHGTAIGGARPKALIEELNKKYIAKFSSSTDLSNVIKAEFVAMRLAEHAGLNVARVKLASASNKDVLLIERFDRKKVNNGWQRKAMVSALTLFGLDDMMARYASYEIFAEIIRHKFSSPSATLKELFSRLVFNILCGNTDDHARNHAAFWDGRYLNLTPAYDICPQSRSGNEASQAMLIAGDNRMSKLSNCIDTAHNFLLSKDEALAIFETQKDIIEKNETDRKLLWGRQFLNSFAFEGMETNN
jgi:serine/threonine-protein kinase HipA